jgi:hypothetical protein
MATLQVTVVFHGKRIRIRWEPQRVTASQQNLALAAASLLTPCALVAFTLTCWSAAADMSWTSSFFVAHGFFSHWQSWLIASVVLLLVSRVLSQCVTGTDS